MAIYDAWHVTPTVAVDNELVDFICSSFQEPSIILTLKVLLVLCSCTLLLFYQFSYRGLHPHLRCLFLLKAVSMRITDSNKSRI